MMSEVIVNTDMLRNVVGLAEATKAVIEKQAQEKQAAYDNARELAAQAVTALAKKGFVEPVHSNDVIEGMAKDPVKAIETLAKVAERIPDADAVPAQGQPVKEAAAPIKDSDRVWEEGFGLS